MLSAEEAAQILGLQVRTVRNYVREGRLPGVRIGKQYRIARADLEAFASGAVAQDALFAGLATSGPVVAASVSASLPGVPQARAVATLEVSSVVQIDRIDAEVAERIERTLEAVMLARAPDDPALRVEPLYDAERQRMRVVIVGEVGDAIELLRVVETVVR